MKNRRRESLVSIFKMNCKEELPKGLSEEQKEWFCRFKKYFGREYEKNIQLLKECDAFSEKEWKTNVKHMIHNVRNGNCMAYSEVVRLLIELKKYGQKNLILRSLDLKYIPTVIENQTQLTSVVLSDMDIHSLPFTMSQLTKLTILSVTKCPVYEFPGWIGDNMKNLKTLVFSRCRLSNIPKNLGQCTKLEILDVKLNFINTIPQEVLELERLRTLEIEGNPIKITWTRRSLPAICDLNISQTEIKSIPWYISSKLMSLNWSGCSDITLPFFHERLRYVNLACSTTDRIPRELFLLPNITYINIPYHSSITQSDIERLIKRNITVVLCRK